jgi:tetratricopeptide (TPR) repeat protein
MIRRVRYSIIKPVILVSLAALVAPPFSPLAAFELAGVRAQEQTECAPLNDDAPVTARLKKGEIHRYPLMLTAEQYAQVDAKALSGDITLELTTPDGKKLMKVRARSGMPEGNSVAAATAETAIYFVKITSLDPEKDGAEYQVRMSELRMAGAADRARCQGDYLYSDADESFNRRKTDGYLASLEKYQAALPYYEKAEDWFGAARAVESIGEARYYLANYRDALTAFEQSLLLVRKARQTTKALSLEAKITNNIGAIADLQYDKQKALLHYLQAIALFRKLNNRFSEISCLINVGNIYTATGQPDDALQWYDRALSIHKDLDAKEQRASALNGSGVAKYFLEKHLQAIEDQKLTAFFTRMRRDNRNLRTIRRDRQP